MKISLVALALTAVAVATPSRNGKLFSLFVPVAFKNGPCSGPNDEAGICLSRDECNNEAHGNSIGNCAMGFGVCCQITLSECGSTVTRNCTYIQNPEYPGTAAGRGVCQYNIAKPSSSICFIRLDFVRLNTAHVVEATGPSGACVDKIDFHQGNGFPMPTLCGRDLSGDHMYLDAGPEVDPDDIYFTHNFDASVTEDRRYRYKVAYIECGTPTTPDKGCEMYYFSGISGIIRSYNFNGGHHLNDQHYT